MIREDESFPLERFRSRFEEFVPLCANESNGLVSKKRLNSFLLRTGNRGRGETLWSMIFHEWIIGLIMLSNRVSVIRASNKTSNEENFLIFTLWIRYGSYHWRIVSNCWRTIEKHRWQGWWKEERGKFVKLETWCSNTFRFFPKASRTVKRGARKIRNVE